MSIVKECRSFRPWIWNLGSLLKSGGWLTHTHSHTRSLDKKTGWCSSNTSKYMRYAFQLTFIPLFLSNFCRKSCLVAFWLDSFTPSFCFQYQHFSPFFHFFLFAVLHSIFFSQIDIILGSMFIVCFKSSFIQFKPLFRFTEMNSSKRENMDLVRNRFDSEFQ